MGFQSERVALLTDFSIAAPSLMYVLLSQRKGVKKDILLQRKGLSCDNFPPLIALLISSIG